MLLALGGDGRNGNREESAEKTERVGRETESAVKILEELLIFGYRKNASDIHMEPWEDRFVIRMRIDGMMTMVREFDKSMYQPLVTRAKVISGMDIAKKRVPQDGHFRETIKGIRLDMRTSVIPTIFGEKMVLRFLDRKTEIDHCGTFGMNEENYKKMIQILGSPGGILYLTGPTGCGKTYLVKTLARLLDVPLAITDATSLTEAGYIGDDIESVVSKLLAAADNDTERAERGIIFIDEIDKIAKKKNTTARDVSGESVQQGLLKLLEGSEVEVPVGATSKNAMVPLVTIDTRNILFICGGAFPDLENIIKERLTNTTSIGFGSDPKDKYDKDPKLLSRVTNQDLREFGMIPEFLGRLPVTVTLQGLTKDFLVRILKEPKNAILKQYKKLLAMDEVNLDFDDDALEWIAEQALKKDTGARALRAIIEEFMLDIMFEIPKDPEIGSVTITRAYLEKHGGPRIEMREYSTADKKAAALPGPTEACYKAE